MLIEPFMIVIALLFAFLLGGLVTLKAVQLGLKWNFQISVQQKPPDSPLPDLPNPVQAVVSVVQEKKAANAEKEAVNILQEWLNGPDKKDGDG